ncbi:MAG: hypothetical protein K8R46_03945, partial [Pirellulales bacterium]|nr:hypothetical protein [Pirellulales bacterium]
RQVATSQVLEEAEKYVYRLFSDSQAAAGDVPGVRLVYIVEALAEFVVHNYKVTGNDRRLDARRNKQDVPRSEKEEGQ